MKHTDIKDIITSGEFAGKEVTVCGWVRTSRNSKSVAFVEVNDGTSLKNIQVVVEKGESDYKEPRVGMSVKVTGKKQHIRDKYSSRRNHSPRRCSHRLSPPEEGTHT